MFASGSDENQMVVETGQDSRTTISYSYKSQRKAPLKSFLDPISNSSEESIYYKTNQVEGLRKIWRRERPQIQARLEG